MKRLINFWEDVRFIARTKVIVDITTRQRISKFKALLVVCFNGNYMMASDDSLIFKN